jgi:hypothetical protein
MNLHNFFAELKPRNVYKVGGPVIAWLETCVTLIPMRFDRAARSAASIQSAMRAIGAAVVR